LRTQSFELTNTPPEHGEKKGAHAQGLGRSRGGLSLKTHAVRDGLGNPVRLIDGPAQENDSVQAKI